MAEHAVGSRISLISKSEIRYEGFLNFINAKDNTVGLKNVRMYGTEGRKKGAGEIPANNQLYEYIVFRGADIKDLTVYEDQLPDPAVISATPAANNKGGPAPHSNNAWHQNRDHGSAPAHRGRGSGGYGGGYGGGRGAALPAPRGRGGAPPAPHSQAAHHNNAPRGAPRLEHTGREFANVEGTAKQEFKEDFDFAKARKDIHDGTAEQKVKKAYDKGSSFFDNLSSDVTDRKDRARGQAFREQQKQVDNETFGNDFVGAHANTRYRRAGRGRGRYGNRH